MCRWRIGVGLRCMVFGFALCTPTTAHAQIRSGDEVRLRLVYNPTGRKYVFGRIESLTADSLGVVLQDVVDRGAPRMTLARNDVETVETIAGTRRGTWAGVRTGSIYGLFLGSLGGVFAFQRPRECTEVVVGGVVQRSDCTNPVPGTRGALMGAGIGVGVGAAVGLLVGSLVREPAWREVDVETLTLESGGGPAAEPMSVVAGSLVRVSYLLRPSGEYRTGIVVDRTAESLVIETDRGQTNVPLRAIHTLEVRAGPGHAGIRGATVGAVGGVLLGVVAAAVWPVPVDSSRRELGILQVAGAMESSTCRFEQTSVSPLRSAEICPNPVLDRHLARRVLPGAVLGLGLGYVIGRLIEVDLWDSVWIEGIPVRLGTSGLERLRVGGRFAF